MLPCTHFLVNDLEKVINLPPSLKLSAWVSKKKYFFFASPIHFNACTVLIMLLFFLISHKV